MDGVNLTEIVVAVAGFLFILDRAAGVLERFGGRIVGLKRFDVSRARRVVEAAAEREALRVLAERHGQILALLTPNGGSSVADRVNIAAQAAQQSAEDAANAARAASRAEAIAGEIRADLREHIEQSRSVHGALFARIDAQGRGET